MDFSHVLSLRAVCGELSDSKDWLHNQARVSVQFITLLYYSLSSHMNLFDLSRVMRPL